MIFFAIFAIPSRSSRLKAFCREINRKALTAKVAKDSREGREENLSKGVRERIHTRDAMVDEKLRSRFDEYLGKTEVLIYSVLGALLALTTFAAMASAGRLLWDNLSHWAVATQTLRVLNELLIVLMLVEILHTVRISIRSHVLVTEPFLIVGLIAVIRRTLVISLEMAARTRDGGWTGEAEGLFRAAIVELGLLGLLILVLVFSITLLRRYPPPSTREDQPA
jgi:uncharacterized membrane protein (DUF373 family)